MNLLAHFLLAAPSPSEQAGAFLSDHIRGTLDPSWPVALRRGIQLHRRVDSYTDHHSLLRELVRTFPAPLRRFAPIGLDVYFDHVLAREWALYGDGTLEAFASSACSSLQSYRAYLPPRAEQFRQRLSAQQGLVHYREPSMVALLLDRIAARAKRPIPLPDLTPHLAARDTQIAQVFSAFWPQIKAHAQMLRESLRLNIQ